MHTVALKDTVEEVDWSHNTLGDLSEAKEVLDDNDEDVGEVVRQGAGRLLGLVVPAHSHTMEDDLRWKTTYDGRRLMMEDDL